MDDVYPGQMIQSLVNPDAPNGRGALTITNTAADGMMISKVNATPVEFQEYEVADTMPPMIEGWDGITLERRNDADDASQILYAYTDIATAGSETFLEKYGDMLSAGALAVNAANFDLAASASFPTRTQGDVTFTGVQTPADQDPAFSGTYDGVPGEFQCTSSGDCIISADPGTGELSLANAAAFTFTPDNLATAIVKGDGNYLYFGYWLHKPDSPGASHFFGLLYGGVDMFTVRGDDPRTAATDDLLDDISYVHALAGEARYSGPAAGKYVTRDLAANTAKIGQFTATAELHADFDADSMRQGAPGPATDRETGALALLEEGGGVVNGIIKDFMEGGESLGNWRVTLQPASLAAIGDQAYRPGSLDDAAFNEANAIAGAGMTRFGESNTQFVGGAEARIGASNAVRRLGGHVLRQRPQGQQAGIHRRRVPDRRRARRNCRCLRRFITPRNNLFDAVTLGGGAPGVPFMNQRRSSQATGLGGAPHLTCAVRVWSFDRRLMVSAS